MDGVTTISIAKQTLGKTCPTFYGITADVAREVCHNFIEVGAKDVLHKPVSRKDLRKLFFDT